MAIVASPTISKYFENLRKDVDICYTIANQARAKQLDPEDKPEIILANTMADRVLGLVSIVAPQILETNIPERVQELEKEYGTLDWRVGFKIAEEVAKEKFCKFKNKKEAIEVGIRTGFAYLTLGIVAAPLEGFIGIEVKKRKDGKEYLALRYAGPIRGAGGTASSTSVILADYVRVKMGYAPYDPNETEVKRYTAEVHDYHDRVTNLQYHPSDEELNFMLSHLPVEVDGDPTEKIEVSNYKDLPRIATNLIRGGMCLVVAEGLCQKAPKLWKRLSKWGKDFDLEWEFIKEFIDLKDKIHAQHGQKKEKKAGPKDKNAKGKEEEVKVKANNTFISDMVAGRPVLTHPVREGGFRLRYGRGRTSGFSAAALHPATLVVLDKFIAIGTQMKVERPGKAATVTVCDTLEGPIVRLNNGNVLQLPTQELAKQHANEVEEVLYLGDILFNYGDFSENGHKLVPAGYCPEWWAQEVEKTIREKYAIEVEIPTKEHLSKAASDFKIDTENFLKYIQKPLFFSPTFQEAKTISKQLQVPLHSDFTYFWKLLAMRQFQTLISILSSSKLKKEEKSEEIKKIIIPFDKKEQACQEAKQALELLGIPHQLINKENIVLEKTESQVLSFLLNFSTLEEIKNLSLSLKTLKEGSYKNPLRYLNQHAPIKQRDKAGTFIGARMGRPEKAKMRKMTGSPHVLFPVGEEGGRMRSIQAALEEGEINAPIKMFKTKEGKLSPFRCCHQTGEPTEEFEQEKLLQKIEIIEIVDALKKKLNTKIIPDLIKGVRGTSNREKIAEHLMKGILRAKHNVAVNKDGTTRYDCTELPLTHFKPKEIGTSIERLKELGYERDIHGKYLENDDQILEMRPQDVILPAVDVLEESAAQVLTRVAQFIDDMLVNHYGLKPFYKVKNEKDLVGHLVIGLAPHISAGTVGRIIGFAHTQGLITHPMYHAGLRRDCDGDEAAVMLLLDGLLNFSKRYLPSSRGSTMDAALVLTPVLSPSEVDDQVLGVDMEWRYPLELYEAALEMKAPWEVRYGKEKKKIVQLDHKLDTPEQYEGFGFTHHVDNFNKGVNCSAYKILPSMKEKLFGQMEIARKVRAVDMDDVARMVIQRHFLADIKGNFRKFSMQGFRCGKCNTKYRRPPISNKCHTCKTGKIIFTISEGSVVKYLEPSLELAQKYDFSPYLKQTINLLKHNIDTVFGKAKDKQVGLGAFMGK